MESHLMTGMRSLRNTVANENKLGLTEMVVRSNFHTDQVFNIVFNKYAQKGVSYVDCVHDSMTHATHTLRTTIT